MAKHATRKFGTLLLVKKALIPAFITAMVIMILYSLLGAIKSDFLTSLNATLIVFASFGSSAILLFMSPRSRDSSIGKFARSYLIATLLGAGSYLLLPYLHTIVVAGIATFVISILLYVTNNVHPPAVGIMLAFILFRIEAVGAILVLSGVVLLVAMRMILEKYLYRIDKDLERIYASR